MADLGPDFMFALSQRGLSDIVNAIDPKKDAGVRAANARLRWSLHAI
jgi:hypothetical protein